MILLDIQAAKHALKESIEACLDIGSHIIAEKWKTNPQPSCSVARIHV